MPNSNKTIIGSSIPPFRFVFLMWLVFTVDIFLNLGLTVYGIHPRTTFGLVGVVTAPFLHGGFQHIVSNTLPLLFLGSVLFYFYDRIASKVFFQCYLFTNVLVWALARSANHIGASGLVYALAGFLIFFGIFRRDGLSILISIVVILMYGGMIYGVFPTRPDVSWESHLIGGIVGALMAVSLSKKSKVTS